MKSKSAHRPRDLQYAIAVRTRCSIVSERSAIGGLEDLEANEMGRGEGGTRAVQEVWTMEGWKRRAVSWSEALPWLRQRRRRKNCSTTAGRRSSTFSPASCTLGACRRWGGLHPQRRRLSSVPGCSHPLLSSSGRWLAPEHAAQEAWPPGLRHVRRREVGAHATHRRRCSAADAGQENESTHGDANAGARPGRGPETEKTRGQGAFGAEGETQRCCCH